MMYLKSGRISNSRDLGSNIQPDIIQIRPDMTHIRADIIYIRPDLNQLNSFQINSIHLPFLRLSLYVDKTLDTPHYKKGSVATLRRIFGLLASLPKTQNSQPPETKQKQKNRNQKQRETETVAKQTETKQFLRHQADFRDVPERYSLRATVI